MRLAFLDDPARLAAVPRGYGLVAATPAVELAAERSGHSCTRFEDHIDAASVEQDGRQTYDALMAACDALDGVHGLPASAHWHFRALKIVVDGFRTRGLATVNLVADTQATEALLLLRAGSLALDVVGAALPRLGVEVVVDAARGAPIARSAGSSRLRSLAARARRRRRTGSPAVGLVDDLYGMPAIGAELRARGAGVSLFVPRPAPVPGSGIDMNVDELRALFAAGGLDLFDVAEPRLRTVLAEQLPRSAAVYLGARAELANSRPDVLLGSVFASPRAKAVAAAARDAGVPSVVSRHGELGLRHILLSPLQDLDTVDVELCWGSIEQAYVERHALREVQTFVVGSPTVDADEALAPPRTVIRSRLGVGEREQVVLYVPTDVSGDEWVTGNRAPSDSDHVRHQRSVLAALVDTRMTPVLKPHPAPDDGALEAWARDAIPRVRILREERFAELIHLADAVLLDFPSTSLVQALRGSARIYVVEHPLSVWEPGVREHLAEHGVDFVDVAGLSARLRADTELGKLGPLAYPQEAREPLSAAGAGTAAARAAEAVLEVVATTIGGR